MTTTSDNVSRMVERSELQKMARTIDAYRKQLDDLNARAEQVSAIIEEHQLTTGILHSLQESSKTGRTGARLSIGSGVTLNYIHEGEEEGTALVDIGSGVFGEKPWSEAHSMTLERKEGITLLHKDLSEQVTKLEVKITVLAEEFNAAAEQLQPPQPTQPSAATTVEPPSSPMPDEKETRRPQRRGSRFGNELTLDD
jgi:prefoldin subunit 5|tara:strand:- start:509 stop:1099 length:591 start_codon:yes stop_codon:yes gene_type:complete